LEIENLKVAGKPVIPVANKTDLCDKEALKKSFKIFPNCIYISGKQGEISELLGLLQSKAAELNQSSQTLVNNSRHYEALHKSSVALNEVLEGLNTQRTSDFIALDIRKALFHLGEITGEITSDDLLANIFSRFCIGK
jgi:tRNA modification GTPase